jgi:hypothetical protein
MRTKKVPQRGNRYSNKERRKILAYRRGGFWTAAALKRKFGVSQATIWRWENAK